MVKPPFVAFEPERHRLPQLLIRDSAADGRPSERRRRLSPVRLRLSTCWQVTVMASAPAVEPADAWNASAAVPPTTDPSRLTPSDGEGPAGLPPPQAPTSPATTARAAMMERRARMTTSWDFRGFHAAAPALSGDVGHHLEWAS